MMFTLSTLLLAENVLSQYVPETPTAQSGNLRGNSLANELSGAIAGANLGELKKLRTEKSMSNLKNFVEDQILDKKLGMMEERLKEGIEQKLEGALSATTVAPAVSMEEQEKLIAREIINQSPPVDPNANAELAVLEKLLEHVISDTVIDTITELKMKAEVGEEVSVEEEQQLLGQHIIANVLETFPNASEEKRAALALAIKEAYENLIGKAKGPSSQRKLFFQDFTRFIQGGFEKLPEILQSVQQVVNPLLGSLDPEIQQGVGIALNTAIDITSNPAVQAGVSQILDAAQQASQGQ